MQSARSVRHRNVHQQTAPKADAHAISRAFHREISPVGPLPAQVNRQRSDAPQKFGVAKIGVAVLLAGSLASCAKSPKLDTSLSPSSPSQTSATAGSSTTGRPQMSLLEKLTPSWWTKIFNVDHTEYAQSGSIVLSFQLPERSAASSMSELVPAGQKFAPLLGYFPPRMSKLPATNEIWIELDSQAKRLRVFEGNRSLEDVIVEGVVGITPGEYIVQSKQSSPRWYAVDDYFTRRGLPVPTEISQTRYLKGALGSQALFLSEGFAIHSSPLFTDEVGGVKVDRAVLSRIFDQAPIGVSVVVR